jgi:hypothetical protein
MTMPVAIAAPQEKSYSIAVSGMALTQKIPQGSPIWNQFNRSFENINLSPSDLAEQVYEGHAWTTQHKNHWRNAQNYQLGQHLGLDFDSGDERSTLKHLSADRFIGKYASLLYTTISHTPEKPKARAVFLLDQPIVEAEFYAQAAQALLWLYGASDQATDTQCKDCCRFWYGSPHCDIELPGGELPLAKVKHIVAEYRESAQRFQRRLERGDQSPPPASQAEAAAALRKIPAWQIDYAEWVSILMALHSAFGEAGLSLAEQWGDGYPGEVAAKWKSFKPAGNGTGAITIATVFGIAKKFGWRGIA